MITLYKIPFVENVFNIPQHFLGHMRIGINRGEKKKLVTTLLFVCWSSSLKSAPFQSFAAIGIEKIEIEVFQNTMWPLPWSRHRRGIWLKGWELFLVSHYLTMLGADRQSVSGDIMGFVRQAISWNHMKKVSSNFVHKSLLW